MEIKAVCFDLGGVVVRISYRWAEMLLSANLPLPEHLKLCDDLHSMPGFDAFQSGELTFDQYVDRMSAHLQITRDQAMLVHRRMLIEPFPGVAQLVDRLKESGIVTGCLSNTNAPHWHEMTQTARFPAIRAMDAQVASHEIGAVKPDPAAFRAFERAVGSSQVLLFDDSIQNCVGAREIGWQAAHIDPVLGPAEQMRTHLADLGLI